ncbi:hypothetical protein [Entomospira culicis]|uniref:Uncharacterized protein n=1 Tax=Entomospira culicis TaxID=2719989 RepID=A0A968KWW3_9SPIO|nr:hypothetical protein [Entomospira culicis]NIZ19398.1 hypothetical protein [Entomospira culicis]NIZ69697.1 hypothetical protein [Entomospira culicis]WDI36807.1 hypothetical protein PVA46_05635 [Entomospira culicis]WDI38436.1 hypothetical protein PVA47_05645 [Entomospira culicis]
MMRRMSWMLGLTLFATILRASTAGHEHDAEREALIQSLFAISWPYHTGLQSASILTATTPASLLIWAEGAAILIDAKELVDAGLRLDKRSGAGLFFDAQHQQVIITKSDLQSITQEFRYKDAVFADFMIFNGDKMQYDPISRQMAIGLGQAYAYLPLVTLQEHHDDHDHEEHNHDHTHDGHHHHDHDHDGHSHAPLQDDFLLGRTFWQARTPISANQRKRLGQHDPQLRLQLVINAKPFIKAGLKPQQLRTIRYEQERYGWFNWFSHERLILDFYL